MPPPSAPTIPPAAAGWAAFAVGSAAAVAVSPVCSYGVRAATAITTAVVLLWAAGRHRDALARARRLLAAGLLLGAASGVAAALHTLVTGRTAGPGSWIDWIELSYVPVVVAGLFAIPAAAGGRVRTIADATVAAGALWYVTLVLVVDPGNIGEGLSTLGRLATLGFVLLPLFVMAVMLSVLPRAVPSARPFLVRAAAGVTCVAIADMSFSITTWKSGYDPAGWIPALHQVGLTLLLCAAFASLRTSHLTGQRVVANPSAEAALPYAPLVFALTIAVVRYVGGSGLSRDQTVPVLVIGAAVVVRHAAAVRDHGRLVASLEMSEHAARVEALRDPLTGLANRTAFVAHLAQQLTDPSAHPVAVALLDLNDFKDINDSHGHGAGDRLLQGCAERLAACVPEGGLVARLGGDEFALCQPRATDGGDALVASIVDAFGEPFAIGVRRFAVGPSIGVVTDERGPGGALRGDAAQLLAHADVAMYQAKARKHAELAPAVVLTGAARERAAAFIRMREEISKPELRQFDVLYQPIVDLRTGAVTGVEALLRWRHPTFGEVGPAQFVPLAEQVGSVGVLGRHVLSTAAHDFARWQRLVPGRALTMGVNLSPRELGDPGLPARVVDVWTAQGLDPGSLVLEITEGALMDELDTAVGLVSELRAAGVSVAVDDFGTGYSSLRYLRRFAADGVKIDQEFVQALPDDDRTKVLISSVVAMARSLDLKLVAEGIETPQQFRSIKAAGCSLGQGFLFSPSVSADVIAGLLVADHRYPVDDGAGAGVDELAVRRLVREREA